MKQKIHAGKLVKHSTKNYFVTVAYCGKKDVDVLDFFKSAPSKPVTCKTCIRIMNSIKTESPL